MTNDVTLTRIRPEFDRLGLDMTELDKRLKARDAIQGKLGTARGELTNLRLEKGKNKEYIAELERRGNLVNAFSSSLAGAEDDIADEIENLRIKAMAGSPEIRAKEARVLELDRAILAHLFEAKDALIERVVLTNQLEDAHNIRAEMLRQRGEQPGGNHFIVLPGRLERFSQDWRKAMEFYFNRFISMQSGRDRPDEGEDVLDWFKRRTW